MFYNILAWLLPGKAVDFAVRGLTKASAALVAAEQRQQSKVAQIEEQIAQLRDAKAGALAEAQRAGRIAKNIAGIIA